MYKVSKNYTTIHTQSLNMTIRGIHVTTEHEMVCCQNWKELGYIPGIGFSGLYEIKGLDEMCREVINNEQAIIKAVKDGFKLIPEHELPDDMPSKRFCYIDCQYNRDTIARLYGKPKVVEATEAMPLKNFCVPVHFTGKVEYSIKAHTIGDAMDIANSMAEDMAEHDEFGPLENIEWSVMTPIAM